MENAIPRSPWARWVPFILVALLGLAIRLPQLGARPMHTDEAINAYIVGQLLAGETFTYDSRDRHGPALAALALPMARMQGARSFSDLTESELRLTSVVAGTITILLFGAAVEMFGYLPSLLAAMLFALAPLPVYYDRYFIHESLFCAATFGLILFGWRAFKTRTVGCAAFAGACAALMFAGKETAILHLFALAAAAIVFRIWNLRNKTFVAQLHLGPLLATVGTFLALLAILFTWFGRNWKVFAAVSHAPANFFTRAAGQGHQKPFWYYGQLLTGGWSGGLLVALACLGFYISIRKRSLSPYAPLAYYAFFIVALYSLIPYKTPWLALNLWIPLSLFAARAVESLWIWAVKQGSLRIAIPVACVLTVLVGALIAHDTRQRAFLHPADENNPYAYAHTSDDILGLSVEIADMARQNAIVTPRIAVIASDPWPMPWYLRHFNQVGFWQPGQKVADADFFITSTEAADQYTDQLRSFRPEFFGVRPGVLILLWSPAPK
jgi:uncharacterized protein (TIGR03663 family)